MMEAGNKGDSQVFNLPKGKIQHIVGRAHLESRDDRLDLVGQLFSRQFSL